MTFLDRLERHLGRFAIPGLIRYIVALNALVFLLGVADKGYLSMLTPDGAAIMRGEVWRLVSWIFLPNADSMLFVLVYLMFTWWVGESLEAAWGSFRLNLYYFLGVFGGAIAAVIFGFSFGNFLLSATLLFALASIAPNQEILLWYILPIKLKWVALISVAVFGYYFVFYGWAAKAIIFLGVINYIVFFLPYFLREAKHKQTVQARRAKFEAAKLPESFTLHKCVVCGITEVTNPHADFRVADDDREYCADHLPRETAGTI